MIQRKAKPDSSPWTDEQWDAISAEGNNILVAAAAGSGKTAVLVERIIRKVTEAHHPADIDRMLVVTFTNAAAAEMRHRIGKVLEDKIKQHPDSVHLRRQLTLLQRAPISTLHSFCMNVVRQYYYLVDIDPQFRITDEIESELLKEEVLDSLFEEEYEANNSSFFDLVDRYSGDRSDEELRRIVLQLDRFSRSHPRPEKWLRENAEKYETISAAEITSLPWYNEMIQAIKKSLAQASDLAAKAWEAAEAPSGPQKYLDVIIAEYKGIAAALAETDYRRLAEAVETIPFAAKVPSITKKDEVDENLKKAAQNNRNAYKDVIGEVKKSYFTAPEEILLTDLQEMSSSIRKLMELTIEFQQRFFQEKKARGILDFSDLEHLTLRILTEERKEFAPSDIARQYSRYFHELLIDEYQDTNAVQETILTLISAGDNRFMVGDVKQSIYRFRLAEPSIFIEKYKSYSPDGSGAGLRIDLAKNFRSRKEVLQSTNYVFRQLMDESVGDIAYDDAAELKIGNTDYDESIDAETSVVLVDEANSSQKQADESDDDAEELAKSEVEAKAIAAEIQGIIESKRPVFDKSLGATRPVQYRDIVILMRSMPWAETILDELRQSGIPAYADLSSGYFHATEVQTMLSLLKIIDNPYQDIPLAAVLRSPVVGLNEEQLAAVRLYDKNGSFYSAVIRVLEGTDGKDPSLHHTLTAFKQRLEHWRNCARSGSLSRLIWQIYEETGYVAYAGGMPGGKQRQANLQALYDRAKGYEETSFRGLFRFLRFIERMEERGDDLGAARAVGEQEDVVRLMTVHKSKGLEFPVVMFTGLGKPFNMSDVNQPYLMHKELGFASKMIDPDLRTAYPSIPQQVLKNRVKNEMSAEEMRVMYVAMTRAKEKLFLIGTVSDLQKKVEKWSQAKDADDWVLPEADREKSTSFIDWLGLSLYRHRAFRDLQSAYETAKTDLAAAWAEDPSIWTVRAIKSSDLAVKQSEGEAKNHIIEQALASFKPVPGADEALEETIRDRLNWSYPFHDATVFQAKQTVTELKKDREADYSSEEFIRTFETDFAERPAFLQKDKLSAAEIGTVIHEAMERINLTKTEPEQVQEQLNEWMKKDQMLEAEAAQIAPHDISAFFSSAIGRRMKCASQVEREIPFSYLLPAHRAYSNWEGSLEERVFVQGMIDAVFREEDGTLCVVDYKTDRIRGKFDTWSNEAIQDHFFNKYKFQIDLYCEALESSWNETVAEAYLYLFDIGSTVPMK
ncbi:helicase-exonuclease AddAB subunit AddA [Salisediminibacterium halotolerans]|uniref:helicase-exonuclease AddAB subunit AddA n=1 Tax=Salisediminibacterium halotolerans TaxID=517425 RepID=UPI000F28DDD3|nr:helicase-exonuclease AddAB subunit AddA [Salisediminibacterium halotolerans]RLJ81013.1 DNA helicase/exodeoxyribonuclease V subunit A [Actinophytocola xinjiangensis]RPE87897.1 DNA helicase/exodeoxyribonuclease V subunit A [Salisediminibacterium halotolerans]TWG37906.1 DNA helicase/exodeoxyribonuclease V subunit A [Salisediminibacterium halotolerans]GEL08343.1 ATP-dependent helicase/nuclease subunit A [Salisediminibacterium halotolerans]